MHVTFKQMEAFIALVDHGTFDSAARHLDLAQSAISRQVQDLESWFGFDLLDRKGRTARLNIAGQEVVELIRHALLQRDIFDSCLMSNEVLTRKLRVGVTELAALTWLPDLVKAIAQEYPRVCVEPVVDLGSNLKGQLIGGRLDIVVIPDAYLSEGLVRVALHTEPNSWYCSPGIAPANRMLTAHDISSYTLLAQGKLSGSGVIVREWLDENRIKPAAEIPCNSLVAVIGLAISGLGIAYLPDRVALPYVEKSQLVKLDTTPSTPSIRYVAMARTDSFGPIIRHVTEMISNICNSVM